MLSETQIWLGVYLAGVVFTTLTVGIGWTYIRPNKPTLKFYLFEVGVIVGWPLVLVALFLGLGTKLHAGLVLHEGGGGTGQWSQIRCGTCDRYYKEDA